MVTPHEQIFSVNVPFKAASTGTQTVSWTFSELPGFVTWTLLFF